METESLVHQYALGQQLGAYRKPLMKDYRFTLGCVCLGIPVLLWVLVQSFTSGGSNLDVGAVQPFIVFLGLLFFAGAISVGLALLSRRNQTVLYEQGIAVIQGDKSQAIRFDQIAAVLLKKLDVSYEGTGSALTMVGAMSGGALGGGRTIFRYKFKTYDGRTVTSDFPEVGGRVLEEVIRRELPLLQQSYKEGGEIQFGPLLISKQGVASRKGILPWSELEPPTIDQELRLVIKRQKDWLPWLQVKLEQIPNFPMCWELLVELQKRQGSL